MALCGSRIEETTSFMDGLIGKKVGMSHLFLENGTISPVTVIEAGPCTVTQIKSVDNDGYNSVQLGFGHAKKLTSPQRGHLKGLGQFRRLREFKVADIDTYTVGQTVDLSMFSEGDYVDVVGTSKGKGFAGGVKRHGFAGGPKTHGQSDRHRAPGSIGATTTPGRVLKGIRMAGHMGDRRTTVQNLKVVRVDSEKNLLLLKGAVPGSRNGLLLISKAVKKGL
ncbi:MAG: ribosomal protein [Dehalococcoidia bacterium]|nr:ribosomal protein [Dehalococcoidia bacterium]